MQIHKKLNVLFLEDDADTRALVEFTLTHAGMNVFPAKTIAEAWRNALAHDIDLYLLDGLTSDGESYSLCRDLRRLDTSKPIVFYSGLAQKTDVQKGIDAGANGYLIKPFDGDLPAELLRYMRKETPAITFSEFQGEQFEYSAQIRELPAMIDRGQSVSN